MVANETKTQRQAAIIADFERGLLSADGDVIVVSGAIRIGEPHEIRNTMRAYGYLPVSGTAVTLNSGEVLALRWTPMSDEEYSACEKRREAAERRDFIDLTGMTPEQFDAIEAAEAVR
jgi:hypothetical protein